MSRSRWPEIAEVIVAFAPSMATAHAHLLAMKIAALYDAALLADTPSVEPAGLREAVLEALELGGTESLLRRVRAVLDVNAGEDGLGYQEAGRLAAIWTRDHAIAHVRAALALLPTQASDSPEKTT